jgi:hypothetical protein
MLAIIKSDIETTRKSVHNSLCFPYAWRRKRFESGDKVTCIDNDYLCNLCLTRIGAGSPVADGPQLTKAMPFFRGSTSEPTTPAKQDYSASSVGGLTDGHLSSPTLDISSDSSKQISMLVVSCTCSFVFCYVTLSLVICSATGVAMIVWMHGFCYSLIVGHRSETLVRVHCPSGNQCRFMIRKTWFVGPEDVTHRLNLGLISYTWTRNSLRLYTQSNGVRSISLALDLGYELSRGRLTFGLR